MLTFCATRVAQSCSNAAESRHEPLRLRPGADRAGFEASRAGCASAPVTAPRLQVVHQQFKWSCVLRISRTPAAGAVRLLLSDNALCGVTLVRCAACEIASSACAPRPLRRGAPAPGSLRVSHARLASPLRGQRSRFSVVSNCQKCPLYCDLCRVWP